MLHPWRGRVTSLDGSQESVTQGCLLLKDAQAGALRGQGATWLRSRCPAGKHASGPFLSIGQMAALCFVCLIFQSE